MGSLLVLCCSVPLVGWPFGIPLLGFQARTAGNALRGAAHPLADWRDFGGILPDGLRVLGATLGWGAPAPIIGAVVLVVTALVTALAFTLAGFEPPELDVLSLAAVVLTIPAFGLLLAWFTVAHLMITVATIRMVAANRFREGVRFGAVLKLIGANIPNCLFLLLTIILIDVLGVMGLALCLVGVLASVFWAWATVGVAMGRAGRAMGLAASEGYRPPGEQRP